MRKSSALKSGAFAFILVLAANLPAAAYTQEDIDACTPDAMRLCQQVFPNKTRIVLCLMQNKPQLNAACTQAFNRARTEIASRSRSANVQLTKN
jgi:hypothetical protein